MRVSAEVSAVFLQWQKDARFLLFDGGEDGKYRRSRLRTETAVIDCVPFVTLFFQRQVFRGYPSAKGRTFGLGGFAQWASFF
jgi:hypothetical protein